MIMVQLDERETKTGTLGMLLQSCSYAVGRVLAARGARWPRRVKQGASKRCHGRGQRHTGHAGGAVSKPSNKSRRLSSYLDADMSRNSAVLSHFLGKKRNLVASEPGEVHIWVGVMGQGGGKDGETEWMRLLFLLLFGL